MSDLVSIITATGGRPEALALCESFVNRQTYPNIEWIVVDDGQEPSTKSCETATRVLRPQPFWHEKNTLARNLKEGLFCAKGEYIAFFEDDDWYHPEWIAYAVEAIKERGTVMHGEARAKYYHIPSGRYRQLGNDRHASLCQTVIRKSVKIDLFVNLLNLEGPFFDIQLWKLVPKSYSSLDPQSRHVVGMKGLPGRSGIGSGHCPPKEWAIDHDSTVLKGWVGADAGLYSEFVEAPHA